MEPTRAAFNWRCASGSETNQQTYPPLIIRWAGYSHSLEQGEATFNLSNTPQFGLPATNISSPGSVGKITTLAGDPRVTQFALKLVF